MARYSASVEDLETLVCFLVFQEMGLSPKENKQVENPAYRLQWKRLNNPSAVILKSTNFICHGEPPSEIFSGYGVSPWLCVGINSKIVGLAEGAAVIELGGESGGSDEEERTSSPVDVGWAGFDEEEKASATGDVGWTGVGPIGIESDKIAEVAGGAESNIHLCPTEGC
ncbi:hypothetical protein CRG98_029428 [Punica granatum]|uniref:Uncharacterized protein n=1 Tax=Punica granatum TaxID=22663 RepID=A0A2I0J1R6_PUNGR|nr:hypothetical protein CRG98_029428 [Punica granatum]